MDKQNVTSKNGIENFRAFQVIDFGLILKTKTRKTRLIISRLVNFKECVSLEEDGNFRGFSDLILSLILKSKTQKIRKFFHNM